MTRAHPKTPLWVKLTISALVAGALVWWVADRHDRRRNERRLGAIASEIAGRDVRVKCPGPIGRLLGWDVVEGSVRFGPDGKPADETKIRKRSRWGRRVDRVALQRHPQGTRKVERVRCCG